MKTTNTTTNSIPPITLAHLLKILSELSDPPKVYGINIKEIIQMRPNLFLPDNTIFVSMDLAKKLERILNKS